MTGMKRWLAGLLAGMMLLSGNVVLAEKEHRETEQDPDRNTVRIQENLVTREGETDKTTQEHLAQIIKLLKREEVRKLLKIEDVNLILSDVVVQVLIWMVENRPVTMKILAELGVGEEDLRSIEKIWDSLERIRQTYNEFAETEDGKKLIAEVNAFMKDPEFRVFLDNFLALFESESADATLDLIKMAVESGKEQGHGDGPLTEEALKRQLGRTTFVGTLLISLLGELEQSEWVRESVPKMLQNEQLWQLLAHLAEISGDTDRVLRTEIGALMGDTEIRDFLERALQGLQLLGKELKTVIGESSDESNENQTESEEAAP